MAHLIEQASTPLGKRRAEVKEEEEEEEKAISRACELSFSLWFYNVIYSDYVGSSERDCPSSLTRTSPHQISTYSQSVDHLLQKSPENIGLHFA